MFNSPAEPEERAWKKDCADVGERQTILWFSFVRISLAEFAIYPVNIGDNEKGGDDKASSWSEVTECHIGGVEVVSRFLPDLGIVGV